MARPSELVRVIAEALGVPEQTVVVHDRNLAKKKLRSVGARGLNAAQVTPRDAAMLVTAILASGHVKDSVSSVERYVNTMPDPWQHRENPYLATGLAQLAALPAAHSFIDALEAIIASATDGTLGLLLRPSKPRAGAQWPWIEIGTLSPGTLGQIQTRGLGNHKSASANYVDATLWEDREDHPPMDDETYPGRDGFGDLERYHRISFRTISKIADLLAR